MKFFDLTPYRADRNIGLAYNELIDDLPSDAYILIRDPDTMYLYPEQPAHLREVINQHHKEYALIGALCNRLGYTGQLLHNDFDEEMNIPTNYISAKRLFQHKGTEIKSNDLCAGFLMCLSKATWKEVGYFPEGEGNCWVDQQFSKQILAAGLQIGIAQGISLFHAYRPWESTHQEAWQSIQHLR